MNFEYVCPKKNIRREEVRFLQVFFTNGDFFTIRGEELSDLRLVPYDTPIRVRTGFSPVIESGRLVFRIRCGNQNSGSFMLYNPDEYLADRKKYVERRCTEEGGISHLVLFDANNWSTSLYGDIIASISGESLVFRFLPNPKYGAFGGAQYRVPIAPVRKEDIHSILIDFENCDSFTVYADEIVDLELHFSPTLECGSSELCRLLTDGVLTLKLDRDYAGRQISVYQKAGKRAGVKELEARLCGNGKSEIDVCHLYVTYNRAGFGNVSEECIEIDALHRPVGPDEDGNYDYEYVSGYAEKQKDGTVRIVFGKPQA